MPDSIHSGDSPVPSRSSSVDNGKRRVIHHSMNRRCHHNDYTGKRIYMITFLKAPEVPGFGSLCGDPSFPNGHPDAPRIILSDMGRIIDRWLYNVHEINENFERIRSVVMPDHAHFILYVKAPTKRKLGKYIGILKAKITTEMWKQFPQYAPAKISAFAKNYNDSILLREGQLEVMKKYIEDNPRRLAIKRKYPDFFTRGISIRLDEFEYEAYGNPFLLQKPFRFQVMVRSFWTDEEYQAHLAEWLSMAKHGGIAVSPFYSKREKEVRDAILEQGGSLIYVRKVCVKEREKPVGRFFDLCAEGRLLMINEREAPEYSKGLNREEAMRMNFHSEKIASAGVIHPIFRVKK